MIITQDFMHNLMIAVGVSFVSFIAKAIWKEMNAPNVDVLQNKKLNLPVVRKQFIISLFILIGSFIAFPSISNQFLQGSISVLIFFAAILAWGAFDAVYYDLKKIDDNNCQEVSNKASNKTSNDA